MKADETMKASEVLIEAKKLLASKKYTYICVACFNVLNAKGVVHRIVEQIAQDLNFSAATAGKGYIPIASYRHWLLIVHNITLKSQEEMIAASLQYADALINYYQQQGD